MRKFLVIVCFFISYTCSSLFAQIRSTTDLYFQPGGTTQLTLQVDGKAKFMGSVYVPFNKWIHIASATGEDNPRLSLHHTGIHGYIDYMDNLYFRANKNWISSLSLYGNGSVGIGFHTGYTQGEYKNQGYKLAVNGGIICEELKVITDVPDADYVFERNYKLNTLPEVESYILENKHLPNIPSAADFKKDGYKVGEMDEMLLRKVEEMTLYLISQNKRIEALEKENRKLKREKK